MRRRDFVKGLGIAVALPKMARAQQETPTIGFLSTRAPNEAEIHTNAFRRGLGEMGYVEGRNVNIEYRWAKGDYGQLASFAADLRSKPLAVMVAAGDPAALAAKAAATSVPIVFLVGGDPVQSGLVASMNRPGNLTGVNFFTGELGSKRLELLCAMVPSTRVIGSLINPRFGAEANERSGAVEGTCQCGKRARSRTGRAGSLHGCGYRVGFRFIRQGKHQRPDRAE